MKLTLNTERFQIHPGWLFAMKVIVMISEGAKLAALIYFIRRGLVPEGVALYVFAFIAPFAWCELQRYKDGNTYLP